MKPMPDWFVLDFRFKLSIVFQGMMRDPDLDADVLDGYRKMYLDKTILRPEETAEKLARILHLDKYESGQHVDYYDDEWRVLLQVPGKLYFPFYLTE